MELVKGNALLSAGHGVVCAPVWTHRSVAPGGQSPSRRFHKIGVRATGIDPRKIGSRRKGGFQVGRTTKPAVEQPPDPWVRSRVRQYMEEGHQSLDDAETLLERANNPFALVLSIAEDANEYLRNHKEEAITRKPILKVISDRINDIHGDKVRDAYTSEKLDYSQYDTKKINLNMMQGGKAEAVSGMDSSLDFSSISWTAE